jgi:trk system potassium uptake protein TrkA
MRQYAVVGMGRIGSSLLATLGSMGHDVLGMDTDEDLIQDLSAEMPGSNLVSADAAEGTVLRDLGLENFDGAAVMIGEDIQANVLVTLILKELGVPLVISRATTSLHARVLERIGADRVVQPEREFGEFLAHSMASPNIQDYLDLGEDQALARMVVPKSWVGQTLAELQLPRRKGVEVVTLKSEGRGGVIPPRSDIPLREGDVLVLGGAKKRLDQIESSSR